ncbi:Gag-Pol polyprotein-like protein [Argiope bruennichi]|uniref:Gag-Pol polyprotein-like protein n=1 Tax=Argiope bruennichi TaxID=94029 RepID=A0A8T0F654_ARGBR|nr:Gag-Pol polyprotein-like protein [Argiope bruennichi]
MAFMSKGRKQDLIKLATELGEEVEDDLKVIELRELILKTSIYKEDLDFVKDTLENIMTERLEREERERVADVKERIERDRAYELEKLRLQVESQKLEQTSGLELLPADQQATYNLKKLLPDFDPQDEDMTLFLNLFERQMKILKIGKQNWGMPWIPSQSRRDPSYKDRTPLLCYGCGEQGVVKAKCAKCNPMVQGDRTQPPTLNHTNFYSILMESQPSSIIEITICGSQAAVCADTRATHSVAGEKLYHFLKNNGRRFENSTVDRALSDGHVQKTDILTTTVDIGVAEKVIPTKLIVLKNSKGNRTFLGTDFLRAAGIVLDLQKGLWRTTDEIQFPAQKVREMFQPGEATANECAITLIEDIFLRYGIPRRIISDNGSQFVSAVLQQVCCTINISQNLIPVYFPQSNPVERKNRDLKPRLAILVGYDHGNWHSKLPMIRLAMNTAVCDTTGHTPAFLQFGRELRTVDDVVRDFKADMFT